MRHASRSKIAAAKAAAFVLLGSLLFGNVQVPAVLADPPACDDPSLIAYWPFDEGEGSATADATGNGHDGTLENGPSWSATVPALSYANPYSLSFDGNDDQVRVPTDPALLLGTDAFTISLFAKTATGDRSLMGNFSGSRGYGLYFYATDRANFFGYGDGGTNDASQPATLLDDVWHHVAGVYNRSGSSLTIETYVDGALVGTNTAAVGDITSGSDLLLGKYLLQPNYQGLLDDVRMYDRALNLDEVGNLAGGNCATICGNGDIEVGEMCDDNNTNNSDGCSSTCQVENNFSCQGEPSVCGPDVLPGKDYFETPPGTSLQIPHDTPIPADFFCPGSAPFSGIVIVGGNGAFEGTADTVIHRMDSDPARIPSIGSFDNIPIEIVALNLTSTQPITVTCGVPTQWNVEVGFSAFVPQLPGNMTITKTHPNGGTFDATLPVIPRFTFTPVVPGPPPVVFDAGNPPPGGTPQLPYQFFYNDAPWTFEPCFPEVLRVPGMTSNFCAGATDSNRVITNGVDGPSQWGTKAATYQVCGNGVTEVPEQCDDGNVNNDDGCSNTCQLPVCGDGLVQGAEQCDDSNTTPGDGCSETCNVEIPLCNGVPATVFVYAGVIYGGPNNGAAYGGILNGGSGNDVIVGTPGPDTINGRTGNDIICGLGDSDVLNGEGGNDVALGDTGNDNINGGSGNDDLRGEADNDTLNGSTGNDNLSGGSGVDSLIGDGGNDTLGGDADNDSLNGGTGNDKLIGSTGSDTLSSGTGNDVACGGADNDTLLGDTGNDRMDGGSGTDTLMGQTGIDVCVNAETTGTCENLVGPVAECAGL